jgi:hypothetical protein
LRHQSCQRRFCDGLFPGTAHDLYTATAATAPLEENNRGFARIVTPDAPRRWNTRSTVGNIYFGSRSVVEGVFRAGDTGSSHPGGDGSAWRFRAQFEGSSSGARLLGVEMPRTSHRREWEDSSRPCPSSLPQQMLFRRGCGMACRCSLVPPAGSSDDPAGVNRDSRCTLQARPGQVCAQGIRDPSLTCCLPLSIMISSYPLPAVRVRNPRLPTRSS